MTISADLAFVQSIKSLSYNNPDLAADIVILTGAGISAESGLQTFRGAGGLWCGHRVEDVATPEAFIRNPALVHQFYNERRQGLLSDDVAPNPAHIAIARLQQNWGGTITLITQNIDDLHERGGAQGVLHMHGEILKSFCTTCRKVSPQQNNSSVRDACPACNDIGTMRPDIVWFGEMPYHMDTIEEKLMAADLFISIGTSGNVYPAAGFVMMARNMGAKTLEINLEPSKNAYEFDHGMYDKASLAVPRFVDMLLCDNNG